MKTKEDRHRQFRALGNFQTREENGERRIEGYFAVFGSVYELWEGATESIDPQAFGDLTGKDIRALINHDTRLVLGRTAAGTLELRVDNHGLWGSILINPDDTDAMNQYSRVQRGDVSQCSFGFDITEETTDIKPNGDVHWTLKSVELYEVSVVTFPAYKDTAVVARKADYEAIQKRRRDEWAAKQKNRLEAMKNA